MKAIGYFHAEGINLDFDAPISKPFASVPHFDRAHGGAHRLIRNHRRRQAPGDRATPFRRTFKIETSFASHLIDDHAETGGGGDFCVAGDRSDLKRKGEPKKLSWKKTLLGRQNLCR
ncbi:hypothetical protein HFN88_31340 [Rhizobium laguerreae]|uniref:hypothetical protein n=1 Tax=Rhizobium laguerreae TaxID=1076926 RepID=UPI001C9267EE|nr:hypothetical protein [Rhizobium laguerreae]MBY3397141.1 hypothetical protein [Rhizobium laguerreae]MBY3417932.1 hypothetical protein [Rhizobium laguerreae]MBY3502811.1 hypothetical protein [Rhizobium laguerreae]MBY3568902.1 hypothetical protein [Rhizobium laguerreae]